MIAMKRAGHKRVWFVVLAAAAAAVLLVGTRAAVSPQRELGVRARAGKPGRFEAAFEVMGTDARFDVVAADLAQARRILAAGAAQARLVERLMSTYRPESEVSRLNARGGRGVVALSEPTLAVLRKAVRVWKLTGGAFDVTYAPLRTLWRQASREGRVPSQDRIDRVLKAVGSGKLVFESGGVRFAVPGMEVDLGGIAKGYAIDLVTEALQAAGARAGIVDIGGDLRLFGRPEGQQKWRVRVRRPPDVQRDWVLALPPAAVATSGDYARFFRIGERRFSHIVDPRTGRPVQHVSSATVTAADAVTADALATAISVLGAAQGVKLIDSLPGTECMIMVHEADGGVSIHQSAGFAALVEES